MLHTAYEKKLNLLCPKDISLLIRKLYATKKSLYVSRCKMNQVGKNHLGPHAAGAKMDRNSLQKKKSKEI